MNTAPPRMDKRALQASARKALDPIVALLAAFGVAPLLVSLFGVAFSVWGAVVVARGSLLGGGVFLLIAGLCDVLDGDLARRTGKASPFGAFIDSTLDRVGEFVYFGGILLYVVGRANGYANWEPIVILLALMGSVLTSYARARAEGIGVECKVGVMERPERIALLALGLIAGYRFLMAVMILLAATSLFTVVQRVRHVHRASAPRAPR
ncbi:MAG TPA: CDP-alcohol phosphatidyltransferase family protein [Candidatus Krumholzibacteria bacterium]|nr:CDP-alcohol phosphatidyltransferase family protein [Candidatus Krumholzibacteria bacterium]